MVVIKDRVVRTRKPHRCWGCTMLLPAGSRVLAVVSAEDGRISTAYWCDTCAEIAQEQNDGEGFYYGEMQQEAEERRGQHETNYG